MTEEQLKQCHDKVDDAVKKAEKEIAKLPDQEPVRATPLILKPRRGPFIGDNVYIAAEQKAKDTRNNSVEQIKQNTRAEIERDIIDKMPSDATAEDKRIVRDRANEKLDGLGKHKDDKGRDEQGRGKGVEPDTTKDPPEQRRPLNSIFFQQLNEPAAPGRDAPEPQGPEHQGGADRESPQQSGPLHSKFFPLPKEPEAPNPNAPGRDGPEPDER